MENFDDIKRETEEKAEIPVNAPVEPAVQTEPAAEQPDDEQPTREEQPVAAAEAQPATAEAPAVTQPTAEAQPEVEAPKPETPTQQREEGERPSLSYTPNNRYNPYAGYSNQPPRPPYTPAGARSEQPRKGRAGIVVLCALLSVALLVVSFLGGAAFGRLTDIDYPPVTDQTPGGDKPSGGDQTGGDTTPPIDRGDIVLNVIERDPTVYEDYTIPTVVSKVQDTVVEIRTETTVTSAYYGDFVKSGAGSGVILTADGYILTCDHVISGAGTITVVLTDGTEYIAEVCGQDSWSDLALIKIEANDLPCAEILKKATEEGVAYKDFLAVGEGVIAIGNPLGELGGSVSNGIISALGRKVNVEGVPMTLMQTNAAVNPGNSGGGLFNMQGELIGIVNAKSTGDSVEGIGFAIPISDAFTVFSQLYSQGYVSGRPYLGLYFEETTSGLKILSYDYNDELTGGQTIQNGDMLYSADGTVITKFADLKTVLADKKVGDTMVIQVERYERRGYTYIRVPLEFTITVHEYIPAAN